MSVRGILSGVALAVMVAVAGAQPRAGEVPAGALLKEVWEAAFLEGTQTGYAHSTYRAVTMGERKLILATQEMELTLNRFNQTLQLSFAMSNSETADGKVQAFVVRQTLGKDQNITRKGKVEGNQLVVTTEFPNRAPTEVKMRWNDQVIGLYAQERLFQTRQLQPNTQFDFLKFEPLFDTWLVVHVSIKDFEEVPLLKGQRMKLLRTETKIDKVMGVEFPPEITWVDAAGEPMKRQVAMPGLGLLTTYRTTRDQALAKAGTPSIDVGLSQLIRVNRGLERPNDTREVIYRVRLKGDLRANEAIAADDRQTIRNHKGEEFDLVVRGLERPDPRAPRAGLPPAEYLRSNHYLRSDDARVKELARRAVGDETDPWQKALRIEAWVRQNLRNKNYTEAFATADEVARKLEGDCTEHAVLAAAMCRAVGVPSRTAVGLVHLSRERAMGYHMWLEVWINGKWYALDPTLGLGRVGAGHIKIADQAWNDSQGLLPFLPVTRVLGKLQIEILNVQYEGS